MSENGDVFAFYLPTDQRRTTASPSSAVASSSTAFDDRPEVQAFQTYLSSDIWANEKAKATPGGGWVSANTGLDVANLSSPIDKLSAETFQDPDAVFRFDGSDQMPGAVGAGSFWKEMTAWITGEDDRGRPRQHRGVLACDADATGVGRAGRDARPGRLARRGPTAPQPTRRRGATT